MPDEILTLQEVAKLLKIAERTAYLYAQQGFLPGFKIASAWRFRKSELDAWVTRQYKTTKEETTSRLAAKTKAKKD